MHNSENLKTIHECVDRLTNTGYDLADLASALMRCGNLELAEEISETAKIIQQNARIIDRTISKDIFDHFADTSRNIASNMNALLESVNGDS